MVLQVCSCNFPFPESQCPTHIHHMNIVFISPVRFVPDINDQML